MYRIFKKVLCVDHQSRSNILIHSNLKDHEKITSKHCLVEDRKHIPRVCSDSTPAEEFLTKQVQALTSQVRLLEDELNKQRELKLAYKNHALLLGNHLKSCFQVAQEKGIDPRVLLEYPQEHHSLQKHGYEVSPPEYDYSPELVLAPQEYWFKNNRLRLLQIQARDNGWYISESQVELCNQLGRGTIADIFKGSLPDGRDVAIKCLRPEFFQGHMDVVDAFYQELELLSRLQHPNVIHFIGACLNPPTYAWIVTEYAPCGTLTEWLHGGKQWSQQRTIPLPPLSERLRIATEVAKGMQYLREQDPKILHRDLKPSNVFLNRDRQVLLADFGFGTSLRFDQLAFSGEIGTYIYMSPEVVNHEPYDEKCDIYSYGVLLCELITGDPPYIETSLSPPEVYMKSSPCPEPSIAFSAATGRLRPTLPKCDHFVLVNLICSVWDQHPLNRPAFADIAYQLELIRNDLQ